MKLALSALTVALLSLPTLALAQDAPAPAAAPAPAPEPEAAPPAIPPPSAAAPVAAPVTVPTRAPAYRYRTPAPLAPDADGDAAEPDARPRGPQRYDYLRVGLGFRIGYIGDSGFDTFADSDTLAQVSLDASYAFFTRGKLAVAGGLAYDAGSRTSGARDLVTRLTMHRLTVPIEARYYLAPWVDVFAKVAPGAGAFYARIEDPSSPTTLEHAPWVFAADLSGGASFRLVGSSDGNPRRARLWLNTELGYGITSSHSLRPSADRDEEDVLGADQSVRLGSLAMNGMFWRTGLAMSF
jgi:hypothetical protein